MKFLYSFVFFFCVSLPFQVQAQVLIPENIYRYDFNEFDWSAFINEDNIQKHIDFENQIFNLFGPDSVITGLNLGKSDLIRIEQELGLYKMGVKKGLSFEEIKLAEKAVQLHWENINSIENQMRAYAGLEGSALSAPTDAATPMIGNTEDYYNGVWELYKGDHELLFNMVEKKDEALYKALGADDEAYAAFISPYMERYMGRIEGIAEVYHGSLLSAYEAPSQFNSNDVASLLEMYSGSLEIYKCFIKNFENLEGKYQSALRGKIKSWHIQQGVWGVEGLIGGYRSYRKEYGIGFQPSSVARGLWGFYEAPDEVKKGIGVFLRDDILNNEEFIRADDRESIRARADALLGLNYMGVLNERERELFEKAVEQGVIENLGPGVKGRDVFHVRPLPLPE